MSKEYIKAQTPLPAYFPYPKFLLQMSLSHTARLTYVLLLDRMTLSQKNGWVDVQGRAYVLYPLAGLAEDLQSSISSVTRALRELEAARLIERRSNGFSKPNQVFLSFPSTAQKCTVEMVKNEQPDCSKVSNTIAQNCTSNQINKNNLRWNKINRTKEAYGYQKDPSNHTKLFVDELAAETVQDIFRWKISGMNNQSIADRLNAKKVPSPVARKLQSGAKLSLHFRKSDEPPWSAKAVDRILHNEVYIGKLVQGKTRRLDYRSKKKMNVPMRDWVIVDNTHEAIISAEQFELVQRILETETRRPNDAETVALFAGFLYCGDCGSRLVRRSASYKGKRYIYYQCSSSKQNKGSCTSHNLRDEKLYNIVRNALQMQIQIVMEEAEFVESIRQAQQEPYRVRRIERQIRQLTAEKAHTQCIKEKLYGDYADEILTREDFLNYNELYSKRIEEYDRKITELEAERQNLQTAPNAYPFLDVYRKYRKLEEITRPMVVELIEKIEVYEGNRVEITFRFHDEIADLLEELHQKHMGQREVSA